MYYVIKKQPHSPVQCFIGFKAPKYIAAKNSDNVIFEFMKDNKVIRKWVKKDEIVLLTEDKDFFTKTMDQFKAVEKTQQKLVNEAKEKLNQSMETFTETINTEIEDFSEIKDLDDVPCILRAL